MHYSHFWVTTVNFSITSYEYEADKLAVDFRARRVDGGPMKGTIRSRGEAVAKGSAGKNGRRVDLAGVLSRLFKRFHTLLPGG